LNDLQLNELPSANLHPANAHLDIAVVVPTFDERENVSELIGRLESALEGLRWEAIFVDDDSPDGTADLLRSHARLDHRIRLIHRIGRRGLASACIEGILSTTANFVAVMDADLQHDETILPQMLARLRADALDIVVATRNAEGGSMGHFSGLRLLLSRLGRTFSNTVCHCDVSDPMSGFFLVNRGFFLEVVHRLKGNGFKILVDILASSRRPVRVAEVGYTFRRRIYGCSKLNFSVGIEYLILLLNKLMGDIVPIRFALFCLVGAAGMVTHLLCLGFFLDRLHLHFLAAQTIATYVAMTENFFLNNLITYSDKSLRGLRLWSGLVSFWVACSFGAWANVIFSRSLLQSGMHWYFAGICGIILSSVWNYSVSNLFTWQMPLVRTASEDAIEPQAVEILSDDLE
jgi:dolichol-phosphate mannosyltransferase